MQVLSNLMFVEQQQDSQSSNSFNVTDLMKKADFDSKFIKVNHQIEYIQDDIEEIRDIEDL